MSKKIQKNVLLIGVFVGLGSVIKAQETKTVTVNSGHVVAYGKYIPPPYTITLKQGPIVNGIPRDTIFINGFSLDSLRRAYLDSIGKIRALKRGKQKLDFFQFKEKWKKAHPGAIRLIDYKCKVTRPLTDSLSNLVKYWKEDKKFLIYVKELLNNHPNVAEWCIRSCGGAIRVTPCFEYKNKIYIWSSYNHYLPHIRVKIPKEEITESYKNRMVKRFEKLIEVLEEDGLYIFTGILRCRIIIPGNKSNEWISEVQSILKKNISDKLKKELLTKLIIDEDITEEIVVNQEEWKKIKIKKGGK